MSETIAPALTPDEWRESGAVVRMEAGQMFGPTHPANVHVGVGPERLYFHPTSSAPSDSPTPVVLVALGNHALPPESPYKIVPEDVEILRKAASGVRLGAAPGEVEFANGVAALLRSDLERLAAKLAALLPPE